MTLLRRHATYMRPLEAAPSKRHDVRQQPVGTVAMGGNAESPAHAFALWFAERAGFVTNSPHSNELDADERHWPERSPFAPLSGDLYATGRDTSEQGLCGAALDSGDKPGVSNFEIGGRSGV